MGAVSEHNYVWAGFALSTVPAHALSHVFVFITFSSGGEVDAVVFTTGTGGTLAGMIVYLTCFVVI